MDTPTHEERTAFQSPPKGRGLHAEETMITITATQARERIYRLLDEVQQSREPIQIMGKRASAVLVAEEDWRAMQETLYLLSIQGMKESIQEGMQTPVDECAKELDW